MDIRKIALYLSGKTPPEYKKSNRLEFMEYLEEIFGYKYDKLEFYRKQAKEYEEEFYFMILDLLNIKAEKDEKEKIKFEDLINKLELPNEIMGIKKIDYNLLEMKRNLLKKEKKPQKKGEMLESFLETLFNGLDGCDVVYKNLNNGDEEIDLIIKNNISKAFFQNLNSPFFLLEAKNWKTTSPTKIARDFSMKTVFHKNLTKLGILVSVNGFTGEVNEVLKRLGSTDNIMVLISGEDINDLIKNKLDITTRFEEKISNSLK